MSSKEISLERIVADIARKGDDMARGMKTMMQRKDEFASPLVAQLTGIVADPASRAYLETRLDTAWAGSKNDPPSFPYGNEESAPEVIIGSGFHAATYAATRVQAGFPKPLVVERSNRVGGVFAIPGPVFYLNSRNRPGGIGLAGDTGANPNYLPGAPVQTANLSTGDYQTNADMALVIRLTLAKYARVRTEFAVVSVESFGGQFTLESSNGNNIQARRIIDARGLGDPRDQDTANGTTILTFPQFMQRMAGPWPLRGIRRAAIIGAGDSARVSIESLLGISPQTAMNIPALDNVERVDVYGNLPDTMESWCRKERGRYNKIGRYLRPDRFGVKWLNIYRNLRPTPVPIPDAVLVNSRAYDLVVLATGNREQFVPGLPESIDSGSYNVGRIIVARQSIYNRNVFRVGPHAQLPFSREEEDAGVADINNNKVSMFRLASKTSALAATLPAAA